MPHEIRDATPEDCAEVARLAARTFADTFGHLYQPHNLLHHVMSKCSEDYFREHLERGDSLLLLHLDGVLTGYAKVGHVDLPVKPPLPSGAQELHRLYVIKEQQGKGLGKALMVALMNLPRLQVAPAIYLGVWEENHRAQALYHQWGFNAVGKYLYQVGDQYDQEIIMARMR
jgi:ribosomal protein S18 acetylase RimI-like enzyme